MSVLQLTTQKWKPLLSQLKTHMVCRYVVLNRPYAFVQWLQGAKISEKYVLMSEPDHIWLKPMPNPMRGQRPAAFPFFYIEPSKKEFLPLTQKFTGPITQKQAEAIAPIGMHLADYISTHGILHQCESGQGNAASQGSHGSGSSSLLVPEVSAAHASLASSLFVSLAGLHSCLLLCTCTHLVQPLWRLEHHYP